MIDIKRMYEDAMVAPSPSALAGEVQATGALGSNDVLGVCDHNKSGGYMKDGCFHMPSCFKHEILSGKKKKRKNNYTVGMKTFLEWLRLSSSCK